MSAGIQAWKAGTSPTYTNESWDEWETRLRRYELNDLYYHNLQYDKLNKWLDYLRTSGLLYVNTHSVYNPVARLVSIYADKIYPAALDFEHMSNGAVPLMANEKIRTAVIRLFRWSNWNSEKALFVRTGSKYGDSYIRVVDDRESKRVILEVVPPQKVRYVRKDAAGNIKEIWFQYKENVEETPDTPDKLKTVALTREVIERVTGEHVYIYHDNKQVDDYPNPFGFVPVVHVKGVDEGTAYGSTPWAIARPKIDGINSQASVLNDQLRITLHPYVVTIGAELDTGSLNRSTTRMDEVLNIPMPLGGDAKALTLNIDIASALNNVQNQLNELREDLPELFLFKLTDMTVAPSGIALRQYFDLAVGKLQSAQGIYDDALIRAIQMALTIGGVGKYQDFESFDLNSFDRGDMDFTIRQREIIYDALSRDARVKYFLASGAPQTAIWTELGVGEDDQTQWKEDLANQSEQDLQNALDQLNNRGGDTNAPNVRMTNDQTV